MEREIRLAQQHCELVTLMRRAWSQTLDHACELSAEIKRLVSLRRKNATVFGLIVN